MPREGIAKKTKNKQKTPKQRNNSPFPKGGLQRGSWINKASSSPYRQAAVIILDSDGKDISLAPIKAAASCREEGIWLWNSCILARERGQES